MKKLIFIMILISSVIIFGNEVAISKKAVKQGEFFILKLPKEDIRVNFPKGNTLIKTYVVDEEKIALVPVHYSTVPGSYPVEVYRGEELIFKEQIKVLDAEFEKSYITVKETMKKKKSTENVKVMINHAREARKKSVEKQLWSKEFIYPVKGRISSPFGAIRYVNNKVSGYHSGTDFAVPIGEDILASNNGKVVLAMYLNSTGNTVIIDHGLNLFSSYSHLDSLSVEVGDVLVRGESIGKSGNTGFSTGPHLHFTMSVGNTFVDPFLFLNKNPF